MRDRRQLPLEAASAVEAAQFLGEYTAGGISQMEEVLTGPFYPGILG